MAEGDIDQQIDFSSDDEIGDLADTFTNMIESLKDMSRVAERVSKGICKYYSW